MTTWQPGDAPETHPLWEGQVELERGMMRRGADHVKDAVLLAKQTGQMTRVAAVRGLLSDWLPGVAEAITSWVRDVEKSKGGPKPIAYPLIKATDPYVAAAMGMKCVLDSLGIGTPKLVRLTLHIGSSVEYENGVRAWEDQVPDLFHHYANEMDRNRATATHRRRVNINRFNELLKGGTITWSKWTLEQQFRVGISVLDCIMRKTGWFELIPDPEHHRRGRLDAPALVLTAKPGLVEWLGKALDHAETTHPEFCPTIMPPRRWDGTREGGYWTPYVRSPRLVRFKASQETQKERAADEYDALDMPHVYDALHLLQETPWRVNKRVLEVAIRTWALGKGRAKLPDPGEVELPPRTPRMAEHLAASREARLHNRVPPIADPETEQEISAWKRKASPVYRANAKRVARCRSTTSTIQLAQRYQDYEAIYFPHMLDFRGRIYPIANFLQPQGNDIARGLLTFATGMPITEENGGAGWLAIQLATSWGNDKVSFEERIQWVEENETMWRLIAEDPFESREWMDADKPFQSLAAIFEWVDFLNTGYGFYSTLPVMVDGTCNGIQHLAAILRDPVAGAYVNLVPSAKPQDIYKVVAAGHGEVQGLQQTLERIERAGGDEGAKATYWLDLCHRDLPRSLCKRQVMVLPYGGTKDSFFSYTRAWLDEHDPVPVALDEEDAEKRTKRVSFLALHMWDAVNHVVKAGMVVMKWLQDCAKVVAVANQPIYWVTPSGFTVRHFYGTGRTAQHKVFLDGTRYDVRLDHKTAKLSTKEQTQGIAPNYIHSLDAAALVLCLKLCREAGIEDFSAIHDAYGTHAANMNALSQFLREAFVSVHEHDVLAEFRGACERVLVDALVVTKGMDPFDAAQKADEMLPPVPEKGDLDIHDVIRSPYFFA